MAELTSQQIGKCGELLVQYWLLKDGIDSAPMTTDPGIDLVTFPDVRAGPEARPKPITIQVKTTSSWDDGSASSEGVVWPVPWPCAADYIALVDRERDKLWFFSRADFEVRSTKAGPALRLGWHIKRQGKRNEPDYQAWEGEAGIPRLLTLT